MHRCADIVPNGKPIRKPGSVRVVAKNADRERTEFGRRMLWARTEAQKKQVEVCQALGISQGTLSELETTSAGSSKVTYFARLYGVDAHWLASGDGSARPKHFLSDEALEFAALYEALGPGERRKLLTIYGMVIDSRPPPPAVWPATEEASQPADVFVGGDSGLMPLQVEPIKRRGQK